MVKFARALCLALTCMCAVSFSTTAAAKGEWKEVVGYVVEADSKSVTFKAEDGTVHKWDKLAKFRVSVGGASKEAPKDWRDANYVDGKEAAKSIKAMARIKSKDGKKWLLNALLLDKDL